MNIFIKLCKKYKLNMILRTNRKYCKIDKTAILTENVNIIFQSYRHKGNIFIGKESMINCNFVFESSTGMISIGERSYIGGGTNLISINRIDIGNDVTIAWNCYLYDHNSHSLDWRQRCIDISQQRGDYLKFNNFIKNKSWEKVKSAPIKICDKAWIGFNCIILKGVTIGEGSIVSASSVVYEDVEPWTIVRGNPAQFIKKVNH
jgi:galactoside O-acetyltransferase